MCRAEDAVSMQQWLEDIGREAFRGGPSIEDPPMDEHWWDLTFGGADEVATIGTRAASKSDPPKPRRGSDGSSRGSSSAALGTASSSSSSKSSPATATAVSLASSDRGQARGARAQSAQGLNRLILNIITVALLISSLSMF